MSFFFFFACFTFLCLFINEGGRKRSIGNQEAKYTDDETQALKDRSPFFVKPIVSMISSGVDSAYISPNLKTNFEFLEDHLKRAPDGGPWICGKELTGADIVLSFPLTISKARAGLTEENYPRIWAYVKKMEEREGYKRAVKKIEETEREFKTNV